MHNVANEEQSSRGVSDSRTIHLCSTLKDNDLPKPRILECIDVIWYCSCREEINSGMPNHHIQFHTSGAFDARHFHPQHKIIQEVLIEDVHPGSPNYSGPWSADNPMVCDFEMSQDTTAT